MKKINLLAITVVGVFTVACNGGGSSSSGSNTQTGLSLSSDINQCTYNVTTNPIINTSIVYTINGATVGHQYVILAKDLYGDSNRSVTLPVAAVSENFSITATCEFLETPVVPNHTSSINITASTNAFALDVTAAQSGTFESSNQLPYTVHFID